MITVISDPKLYKVTASNIVPEFNGQSMCFMNSEIFNGTGYDIQVKYQVGAAHLLKANSPGNHLSGKMVKGKVSAYIEYKADEYVNFNISDTSNDKLKSIFESVKKQFAEMTPSQYLRYGVQRRSVSVIIQYDIEIDDIIKYGEVYVPDLNIVLSADTKPSKVNTHPFGDDALKMITLTDDKYIFDILSRMNANLCIYQLALRNPDEYPDYYITVGGVVTKVRKFRIPEYDTTTDEGLYVYSNTKPVQQSRFTVTTMPDGISKMVVGLKAVLKDPSSYGLYATVQEANFYGHSQYQKAVECITNIEKTIEEKDNEVVKLKNQINDLNKEVAERVASEKKSAGIAKETDTLNKARDALAQERVKWEHAKTQERLKQDVATARKETREAKRDKWFSKIIGPVLIAIGGQLGGFVGSIAATILASTLGKLIPAAES